MTKLSKVLFSLFVGGPMAALLTACGGGGGTTGSATTPVAPVALTQTLSGTFTDAPVAGATYVTSTGSGGCVAATPCSTDGQGQFSYASGDAITFSAAGVTLGTTSALQPSTDGSTTVTPVNLVSGATLPSDPGPTAIAQYLQTLSTLAAGTSGSGAPGVLTMPTDDATTGKLRTAMSSAGVTAASSVGTAVTKMQAAMDSAFGPNQYTLVPAITAQAALTQGVNSNGFIGTVWNGICTQCGGGTAAGTATIYFQPGGTLTGFSEGNLLAGSWAGSTTSGGGVTLQVTSTGGGYATGSIPANSSTGTATIFKGTPAVIQGSFTFTKITASGTTAATNTQSMGGWYATFTPNATQLAAGKTGGTAYIIAAPDGTFYGITDGSAAAFRGNWSTTTGQGTASWTDTNSTGTPGNAITISMNLASASGTVAINGQPGGTLTFNRQGTLTRKNNQNNSGVSIPLLLGVSVSWANTGANAVTSLALALNVIDASGKLVSSVVRSESTAPRFDGVRTTITDNIAVPYPTGVGATYSLSIGGANCTLTGGSGAINDANSGNSSAYPAVGVTCNPGATATAIPLVLNVFTAWGSIYPAPGYGLYLSVKDPNGGQLSSGFRQQNVVLPTGSTGTVTTTTSLCGAVFLMDFVCTSVSGSTTTAFTTATTISAAYPTSAGATYSLTTGSSYCRIVSGGSGIVVDANKNNPAAYPAVNVSCD
jgi:hypothetical protein